MNESDPPFPIPTAFVDNWEILHSNVEELCHAQKRSCRFCDIWKKPLTSKRAGHGDLTDPCSINFKDYLLMSHDLLKYLKTRYLSSIH